MSEDIEEALADAVAAAVTSGRYCVAVMSQDADAVAVFQAHTPGVRLSAGIGALLRQVMPPMHRSEMRVFLEELLREWQA